MNIKFKPLYGKEHEKLNSNPDRGFRLEVCFDHLKNQSELPNTSELIEKTLDYHLAKSSPEQIKLAQTYFYLIGFSNEGITQKALDFLQQAFDIYRKKGVKMILRFAYQRAGFMEGEPTEVILLHIKQLSEIVHKNKDVIHVLQSGFIGAWGEWHSEEIEVDKHAIINALANILLPNDSYMHTRLPLYKNILEAHNNAYQRIGFNNDAYWGKIYAGNLGSGGFDPNTSQWNQAILQSPFAPQDAELYWSAWTHQNNIYCDGLDAILGMSELHMTSFSVMHGYADANYSKEHNASKTAMVRWMETELTQEWLDKNGLLYSNEWFYDENNNTTKIKRNAFEYIRDYLGYKLEAKEANIYSYDNGCVGIELDIVNYGFSAPFNLKAEFALINEKSEVESVFVIKDISNWHPTSPVNYLDRNQLIHKVYATLKINNPNEKYKIGFKIYNDMGDTALLCNKIDVENGYHILFK